MRSPRSASGASLRDDERVGRDAGEDAPGEEVLDFLGVRAVDEKGHDSLLQCQSSAPLSHAPSASGRGSPAARSAQTMRPWASGTQSARAAAQRAELAPVRREHEPRPQPRGATRPRRPPRYLRPSTIARDRRRGARRSRRASRLSASGSRTAPTSDASPPAPPSGWCMQTSTRRDRDALASRGARRARRSSASPRRPRTAPLPAPAGSSRWRGRSPALASARSPSRTPARRRS